MTGKSLLFATFALLAASPSVAQSKSLIVRTDETWIFSISRGQPVRARRANPNAQPAEGQIVVTVRTMMGTTMSISSNHPNAYTYKAELIGVAGGKRVPGRACTLPANGKISFEHWPQQAKAVRLSEFRRATKDGSCP